MAESVRHIWEVPAESSSAGLRADRCIAESWGIIGRSQLKVRLEELRVNGKVAKLAQLLFPGDRIELTLVPVTPMDLEPEAMDLSIIFENDDVLVVDKPSGMVVHPAAGNHTGTLVHGLLYHVRELADSGFEDENRPGIVHRLDKETSGVLIVAKHPAAHEFLARQFQERSTIKTYLAIATGQAGKSEFEVAGFLRRDPANRQKFAWHASEGKASLTSFRILASHGRHHLVEASPHTGRTHQIRVHLAHVGLPIVGDPAYGKPVAGLPAPRCMLHARRLSIVLPGEQVPRTFEAALPPDFVVLAQAAGLGECPALY